MSNYSELLWFDSLRCLLIYGLLRISRQIIAEEQRAENRRKLDEQVERAEKYIKICF
jgi:hypothetical protein